MNTICKQYIKNAKSFFPNIGKEERKYLKNLELTISEYCEEQSISSLEELYKDVGMPFEVVNNYYENINVNHILHQINRKKIIRLSLLAIIFSLLLALLGYSIIAYSELQMLKAEDIFFEETIIE